MPGKSFLDSEAAVRLNKILQDAHAFADTNEELGKFLSNLDSEYSISKKDALYVYKESLYWYLNRSTKDRIHDFLIAVCSGKIDGDHDFIGDSHFQCPVSYLMDDVYTMRTPEYTVTSSGMPIGKDYKDDFSDFTPIENWCRGVTGGMFPDDNIQMKYLLKWTLSWIKKHAQDNS